MNKTSMMAAGIFLLGASTQAIGEDATKIELSDFSVKYYDNDVYMGSDIVKRPSVDYYYTGRPFGIAPNNLYAEWVGQLTVHEEGLYQMGIGASWSKSYMEIDGETVVDINTAARAPIYLTEGIHDVKVTHENNWFTADFNVTFGGATYFNYASDFETLSSLVSDDTQIIYVGAYDNSVIDSQTPNMMNEITVNLGAYNKPVVLVLSTHASVNWIINNPYNTNIVSVLTGAYVPPSSVTVTSGSVPEYYIDTLTYASTQEEMSKVNSTLNYLFNRDADEAYPGYYHTVVDIEGKLDLPDGSAKPFYGQWDYYNASSNRTERIHVYVKNDQLVMRDRIYIDQTGRITSSGTERTPEYTESFFADLSASMQSATTMSVAVAEPATITESISINGKVYNKTVPDSLLCGGSQPFYGTRNLLIHSPETEEGQLMDDCIQRASDIIKWQSRSGADLWIHRYPLYLVYRADYELSIGNQSAYEFYIGKAKSWIESLSRSPDLRDTTLDEYTDFSKAALAFADVELSTGKTITTTNGRYPRQVMAYGTLVDKPVLSDQAEVVEDAIADIYNAAIVLRDQSTITEINSMANDIINFISRADSNAAKYLDDIKADVGANMAAISTEGRYMISMLESKPSLGDLTSKSGQGYREHYFYAYSQPLREYLDDHPDFTFVGLNVHHSIEKDKDWTRYLGYSKLQSKNNLRGIPLDINPTLHNSKIAVCWNQLYALYPDRSNIPEDILLERAKYIDDQYGHLFVPAIRPVPVQGADFMPDCEPPAQP